jgi:hypothetical protein
MPKGYPLTGCKECDRPLAEVGSLSATGLCADCGEARWTANLISLKTGEGPYFEHWARRVLMAAHRRLIASERQAG